MLLDVHLGLVSLADFPRAAPHKQVLMSPAVDIIALLASPSELLSLRTRPSTLSSVGRIQIISTVLLKRLLAHQPTPTGPSNSPGRKCGVVPQQRDISSVFRAQPGSHHLLVFPTALGEIGCGTSPARPQQWFRDGRGCGHNLASPVLWYHHISYPCI